MNSQPWGGVGMTNKITNVEELMSTLKEMRTAQTGKFYDTKGFWKRFLLLF